MTSTSLKSARNGNRKTAGETAGTVKLKTDKTMKKYIEMMKQDKEGVALVVITMALFVPMMVLAAVIG